MSETGMIVAFAGNHVPRGWAECDGRSVSRLDPIYRALFEAIGAIHGGDGNPNFQLPDLRGRFLRGVDHGVGRDPDAAAREAPGASNTGNQGDRVGSVQGHLFGRHHHHGGSDAIVQVTGSDTVHEITDNSGGEINIRHGVRMQDVGGNETRPLNVYVLFIIKL